MLAAQYAKALTKTLIITKGESLWPIKTST